MGLDSRYVLAPSLQMYFVDKDTGLPLENGQVFFFEDEARTIPKDVFEISGVPPNYSYNVLPNPVSLSSVGTFQDNTGSDILPYYYPFDSAGNIQLYYIEVYDSMGVLQFTREGWPNFTTTDVVTDQDVTNFVPNGQFLLHDNVPASTANGFIAGKISQDVTVIAQGGWTFERGPTSTATDFVTFPKYTSYVGIPSGNPLFAVQIQTTVAGSDARKDLCLKFPNVNTFASDAQSYNLYFEGQSTTGSDITNVQIIVRKFFGTGGSPSATTETVITTITLLGSSISNYNVPILFGTNAGKSIGTNGDDYVQIIVRLPPTGVQSALMTDFCITVNDEVLNAFPQQTKAQQLDPSTAGWFPVPNPNGSDLYCPAVLGPSGLLWDHSSIGEILGLMVDSGSQTGNLLYCDGSAYLSADYSSLGIPYSRLQSILFNTTKNGPLFGTGANFVNVITSTGLTNEIILSQNKPGLVTNPSDTGATGFNFNVSVNAGAATINYRAYSNSVGALVAISTIIGAVGGAVGGGTSPFATTELSQATDTLSYYAFEVTTATAAACSAGVGVPGLYFDFSSTSVNYRLWLQVVGEIAPAAGGKTLLQCNLEISMTAIEVANAVAQVISRQQTNTITIPAVPPVSSYFTFTANSILYYVWYKINNVGTAPVQPFAQLIEVDLTGGETTAQVAQKTQAAINSQYFAVPDLRGYFLRGNDPKASVDTDGTFRYGYYSNTKSYLGTYEFDTMTSHNHAYGLASTTVGGTFQAGLNLALTAPGTLTTNTGGSETRPVNVAVNWFIRY